MPGPRTRMPLGKLPCGSLEYFLVIHGGHPRYTRLSLVVGGGGDRRCMFMMMGDFERQPGRRDVDRLWAGNIT